MVGGQRSQCMCGCNNGLSTNSHTPQEAHANRHIWPAPPPSTLLYRTVTAIVYLHCGSRWLTMARQVVRSPTDKTRWGDEQRWKEARYDGGGVMNRGYWCTYTRDDAILYNAANAIIVLV